MVENRIITFANQKGGVGKSTLCTLFANYLSKQGKRVLVLDCDVQKSIYKRREQERQSFPGFEWLYNVQEFSLDNEERVVNLMESLRKLNGIVLIDSPGNIIQPGQWFVLNSSDYNIVPLQYEASVITSTMAFLQWIELNRPEGQNMPSRFIFLPNKYKPWCGTAAEKDKEVMTNALLGEIGYLAKPIEDRKDLERVQTTELMKSQAAFVKEAFADIYNIIFNSNPKDI